MRTRRVNLAAVALAVLAVRAAAQQPTEYHYRLDAAGSDLGWELPATLHTVHGKAPELSGAIDAILGTNGDWSIQTRIVVKGAAMVTGNASRDRSMREKVLETDRFPEIVFEARRVRADLTRFKTGEHFTVETSGDLTVHGKPVEIQVPVDVYVLADSVILQGSFPLSWKQYDLKDPSFGIVTVRDPLKVQFRLRAVKE